MKLFKKNIFLFLVRQRRNYFGKFLLKFSKSLSEALNNKINDGNINGEYWYLKNLNHSKIKVVFDVGANVGNWSKKILEYNPGVDIHAFEPVSETYEKLKANTKNLKNLKINRIGLSDRIGEIQFNYYPNASYLSSAFHHYLGNNGILQLIEVITGDKYCKENNLNQIDLLKIDTEGFESKVLFGFKEMFEKKQIRMVQFEYGPMAIDSNFLLKDFHQFFEPLDFKVGKIYPSWIDFKPYSKEMEDFVLSNFVAIRKDSLHLISE
jgi:FkbM family methyltransferase